MFFCKAAVVFDDTVEFLRLLSDAKMGVLAKFHGVWSVN